MKFKHCELGFIMASNTIAFVLHHVETTMSETSSCHYQMYMQLGGIDSSVRSTALKELERGIFSFLWHVHYPRI